MPESAIRRRTDAGRRADAVEEMRSGDVGSWRLSVGSRIANRRRRWLGWRQVGKVVTGLVGRLRWGRDGIRIVGAVWRLRKQFKRCSEQSPLSSHLLKLFQLLQGLKSCRSSCARRLSLT